MTNHICNQQSAIDQAMRQQATIDQAGIRIESQQKQEHTLDPVNFNEVIELAQQLYNLLKDKDPQVIAITCQLVGNFTKKSLLNRTQPNLTGIGAANSISSNWY